MAGARHRRRRVVVAAIVVLVVVLGGVVGLRMWRADEGFCGRAGDLPDIASSIARTGSPAAGLGATADRFDRIAAVAPDDATRQAAMTLAEAQRSIASALQGDPTNASAVNAIAAAATPQVAAARSQLQSTFASSCH